MQLFGSLRESISASSLVVSVWVVSFYSVLFSRRGRSRWVSGGTFYNDDVPNSDDFTLVRMLDHPTLFVVNRFVSIEYRYFR